MNGTCSGSQPLNDNRACGVFGTCITGICVEHTPPTDPCLNIDCSGTPACRLDSICFQGRCYTGPVVDNGTECLLNGISGTCQAGNCVQSWPGNLCFPNPCLYGGQCVQSTATNFSCTCRPYYGGHNCQYLPPAPGWNNQIVINSANITTNLSLLEPTVVGSYVDPWIICPYQACRYLFADNVCDPLCNSANCNWDGDDCFVDEVCPDESYCASHFNDGKCDPACFNVDCAWDGGDCGSIQGTVNSQLAGSIFQLVVSGDLEQTQVRVDSMVRSLSMRLDSQILVESVATFVNISTGYPQAQTSLQISLENSCQTRCFPSNMAVWMYLNSLTTSGQLSSLLAVSPLGCALVNTPAPTVATIPTSAIIGLVAAIIATVSVLACMVIKRKRGGAEITVDHTDYPSSEPSDFYIPKLDEELDLEDGFHFKQRKEVPSTDSSSSDFDDALRALTNSPSSQGFDHTEPSPAMLAPFTALDDDSPSDWNTYDDALAQHLSYPMWAEHIQLDTGSLESLHSDASLHNLLNDAFRTGSAEDLDKAVNILPRDPFVENFLKGVVQVKPQPVETVLFADSDPHTLDAFKNSRLMLASARGNLDDMEALIAAGCDVQQANDHNDTALHLACRFNHKEAVFLLLRHSAKVNVSNRLGSHPLHEAIYVGDLDMVNYLLDNGANPDIADSAGLTPLMIAVKVDSLDIAQRVLDTKPRINAKDNDGWTALHWSAATGNIEILRLLLRNKVDIDVTNNKSETSLFLAVREGNADCVLALLEKFAKRTVEDQLGRTCLTIATQRNYANIVCMLNDWTIGQSSLGVTKRIRVMSKSDDSSESAQSVQPASISPEAKPVTTLTHSSDVPSAIPMSATFTVSTGSKVSKSKAKAKPHHRDVAPILTRTLLPRPLSNAPTSNGSSGKTSEPKSSGSNSSSPPKPHPF